MTGGASSVSRNEIEKRNVSYQEICLDASAETERICGFITKTLVQELKKRGAVIGLSGGIDSSVTAALCVKALGSDKVFGILMPERHSDSQSSGLGRLVAAHLGIRTVEHDITPVLESAGCYASQNEAIGSLIPSYQSGFPFKITLQQSDGYNVFYLIVEMPDKSVVKERMGHDSFLKLVAATNYKQRARKMFEYYHADRLNFAVAGSPNRLEYDQGFFVKNGDGSADFKPIAHLYKTQVYQIANFLNIPQEIVTRPPTTDTYPMQQSQEEFYFSLPYDKMDLCLYAKNQGLSPESVCNSTGLTPLQARSVFNDIDAKRKATRYGHLKPLLVENVLGPG